MNQIVNGRICGDIAVSRSFGDIRFKTKKDELGSFSSSSYNFILLYAASLLINVDIHRMLKKGVDEGRWTEKFVSRYSFYFGLSLLLPFQGFMS